MFGWGVLKHIVRGIGMAFHWRADVQIFGTDLLLEIVDINPVCHLDVDPFFSVVSTCMVGCKSSLS